MSVSSAAAAFSFASSGATGARRDLLSVTTGQQVRSFIGMTVQQAEAVARALNLSLTLPVQTPAADAVVATQDPPPRGTRASRWGV